MSMSDDELRGRTVIAADGNALGEVTGLVLDSKAWTVEALRVRLRSHVADQVGAARGLFHAGSVDIPVRLVQSTGDAVVLNARAEELRPFVAGAGEQPSAAAGV
jgi:sporulation protein YlmC with PRC-barrel domain